MNYWDDNEIFEDEFDDEDDIFSEELELDENEKIKKESKVICDYCGMKGHTSLDCPSIDD